MSTQATDTSVRSSIVVEAPHERAFSVFTDDIGSWWAPDHHILEAELAEMVFEPREGGHVYDRGVDGSECRWARVLVFEPPGVWEQRQYAREVGEGFYEVSQIFPRAVLTR